MEHHAGGGEGNIAERYYPRVMPALFGVVIHDKHMVGEYFAEPELACRLLLRFIGKGISDFQVKAPRI